MTTWKRHPILGLSLGLLLVACHSEKQNTASEQDTVLSPSSTQANSEKKDYQRIVSIGDLMTEIVIGLGDSNKIVAMGASHPLFPNFRKPKVGYDLTLRADYIVDHQPDLVLSDSEASPAEVVAQLKSKDFDYYLFDKPQELSSLQATIQKIGSLLQREKKAEQLIQSMQDSLAKVKQILQKEKKDSVRVLYVHARGADVLLLGGSNTFFDEIIRLAGAKNAADEYDGMERLTAEDMSAINPDFILMSDESFASFKGKIYQALLLVSSRAYRTGRLVTLPEYELTTPGLQTGMTALRLARKLYQQPYYTPLPFAPNVPRETAPVQELEIIESDQGN